MCGQIGRTILRVKTTYITAIKEEMSEATPARIVVGVPSRVPVPPLLSEALRSVSLDMVPIIVSLRM